VERERPIRVELPRCPFCHENVKAEEPKHGCADCMAWHHEGCWSESGAKCAACGRGTSGTVTPIATTEPVGAGDAPAVAAKTLLVLIAIAIATSCAVSGYVRGTGYELAFVLAAVAFLSSLALVIDVLPRRRRED
jgi:hypothetical protein